MLKNSKKLVVAIVTLVLTIALATTATFAWFTMNQTVTAGNIDLTVKGDNEGLFISLSDENYETKLETAAFATMVSAVEMSDVSGKNDANVLKFTDINDAEIQYDTETKKSYLKFDLYFRGTSDFDVYLDKTASTVVAGTKPSAGLPEINYWKADTTDFAALYGKAYPSTGTLLETRAAYASRVSFQKTDSPAVIWNPYKDDTTVSFGGGTSNLARDYRNALLGKTAETDNPELKGSSTDEIVAAPIVKLAKDATTNFFSAKITICVWLEGTDGDCFNAVLTDNLVVNLGFTIVAPSNP